MPRRAPLVTLIAVVTILVAGAFLVLGRFAGQTGVSASQSDAGSSGIGMILPLFVPALVIVLVALPFLWRRLGQFTALERGAFALLVPMFCFAGFMASATLAYSPLFRSAPQWGDYFFFFFVPFVPPVVAIWLSVKLVTRLRRRGAIQ